MMPDVSRETQDRLDEFQALLRRWTARINLVSKSSLNDLETRHIADSAQLFAYAPVKSGLWADLGSGGGFPALVVAILAREQAPDLQMICVESDARKAAFLSTAIRDLDLKASVISGRIEEVPPINADILSARALAPLTDLLRYADQHRSASGTCLLPKGATWKAEVEAARKIWNFDCEALPSATDPNARILRIGAISRV